MATPPPAAHTGGGRRNDGEEGGLWHGRLPPSLERELGVGAARRSLLTSERAHLPQSRPEDCDYCELGEVEVPCSCGRWLCCVCRGVESPWVGVCSCGQEL